tara:strand:+ start:10492 stop:11844 length:1353 start_codon:yes stop_codon:yes gene_type:complete
MYIGRSPNSVPLTANDVPDLPASKITSGQFSNSLISASSVSQHATSFDDNKIVNDLSTLGLRVHTQENLNASNSNSASFDVFQDSSAITNLTNSVRNSSEYISSVSISYASPSTTADDLVVLDSYGHTNGQTNIEDVSTGGEGQTSMTAGGATAYSSGQSLTGPSVSIYSGGGSSDVLYNSSANTPSTNRFQTLPSLTNYTIEMWVYPLSSVNYGTSSDSLLDVGQVIQFEFDSSENLYIYNAGNSSVHANLGTLNKDAWNHVAYVKQGSTFYAYKNGVSMATGTAYSSNLTDSYLRIMYHRSVGTRYFNGYIDLFRVTKRAVYADGTTFTPANEWNYNVETLNSTGSFEGSTITASASTSSMGAVITYQDNAGTNALNTDIVLKLSANNGSNYSTATLTALPDFATGIKMAKVNDLSVTAGTQLKYKLEFANQSSGVKEARIRGVSLQY